MKVASVLQIIVGLAGFAVLGTFPAYAQSEVAPDHFESQTVEPFGKANPSQASFIRYDGRFRLPYAVQCNGKSLRPGKYSVSLRSDGQVGRAMLNQKGLAIGIMGVIRNQTQKSGDGALIIEHTGKVRRLSVIQVAGLDLVFDPEIQLKSASGNKTQRIERLTLFLSR